jgi:hypothetical protein
VRMGINIGEVAELEREGTGIHKVVGLAVDVAARIMGLSLPNQILMTRTVFDDARMYIRESPSPLGGEGWGEGKTIPQLQWMAHGAYVFKGTEEPLDIYEAGMVGVAPLREPPDSEKARRAVAPGDEIMLGAEGGWRPAQGLSIPQTENWHLEQKLGEGGFGEVWLAEHKKLKEKRVFKFCFQVDRLRGLKREVVLFRLIKETLGDRNDIARIIDWQFEKPPYFLESEYTPAGSLPDWADKQGGLAKVPMETRIELVAQIAEALATVSAFCIRTLSRRTS